MVLACLRALCTHRTRHSVMSIRHGTRIQMWCNAISLPCVVHKSMRLWHNSIYNRIILAHFFRLFLYSYYLAVYPFCFLFSLWNEFSKLRRDNEDKLAEPNDLSTMQAGAKRDFEVSLKQYRMPTWCTNSISRCSEKAKRCTLQTKTRRRRMRPRFWLKEKTIWWTD